MLIARCCSCGDPAEARAFPLCEICDSALSGSLSCEPWLGDPVDACFAMHLLNEGNYAVLRAWKKSRGPLFDRRVLREDVTQRIRTWLDRAGPRPRAIVPVPQDAVRSLRMGGSPALRIANWISRQTGIALLEMLCKTHEPPGRQAELDFWNRLQNPIGFSVAVEGDNPPLSALLIDDFITTGHTVREAARALKQSGVRQVLVLGLGARESSGSFAFAYRVAEEPSPASMSTSTR